ncbi:MAG: aldehyde:ferredoxin oxidoreductase, partial [Thermoproteota archaeon]
MYEPKPFSKVLYIDLNRRTSWVEERDDLVEEWLGGIGLGIQLLKEENMTSVDPLSPENSIILAVGPFNAAYPLGSKTVALFKSPLTGNLGESYAGGRSSVSVKLAGYMAIVIRGASETPIYLAIHEDRVHFRDASALWGMSSSFTVGRVIAEREPRAGYRSILRIGPAGEKLVRYASVMVESFRHFGRLGLGAVFGSKKLKAIVISGRKALKVEDKVAYKKVYDKIFEKAVRSGLMKKYHELGTTMNVLPLNELGALPTMNLKSGRFEQAENISGEEMASKVLGRRIACSGCPVACIHLAALREPYPHEPFFYKTVFISYDYELAYALGSMLGVGKRDGFLKLLHFVESVGLDAISTGVCFAWATEALERGLISERETLLRLKWGDYESYIKAVKMVVEQPNEFYR